MEGGDGFGGYMAGSMHDNKLMDGDYDITINMADQTVNEKIRKRIKELRHYVRRKRMTRFFLYTMIVYYCFMIFLTIMTGLWEFLGSNTLVEDIIIIIFQVTIIVFLVGELVLKIVFQRQTFFVKPVNYVDVFVLICCVIALVVAFISTAIDLTDSVFEDMIFVGFFIVRNFTRGLTMYFWVKNMYRAWDNSVDPESKSFLDYYPKFLIVKPEEMDESTPMISKDADLVDDGGDVYIGKDMTPEYNVWGSDDGSPGISIDSVIPEDLQAEFEQSLGIGQSSYIPQISTKRVQIGGYHDDDDEVLGDY